MDTRKCCYTLTDGILTVGNRHFQTSFSGIAEAKLENVTQKSRSLPYSEVTGKKEDGSSVRYQMWDDLPVVRIVKGADDPLLVLEGEHWTLKTVRLCAFTDDRDTVVTENEYSFFKKGLLDTVQGEIFFLEDPQTERGIVIISETPDWISGKLSAPIQVDPDPIDVAKIGLDNGGYPIVLGFCKMGGCEELCREYLRHANNCSRLITMSNTWGDRNGRARVCEEFIRKEIEAAKDIGIDVVQIDDGWQMGNTLIPAQRDENGAQIFYDGYWDLNTERFPNGIRPLSDLAAESGIQLGLWFAPYSHDCFAKLERDKEIFRYAYEKHGARFFKLDMYQAPSKAHTDRMEELLSSIYSLGGDVSVQMDITRHARLNYLCGREYGTVFAENRYLKGIYKYYPHRVLRNLWNISRYIPSNRFQFELINPDLEGADYSENDPFTPNLYDMDYLFASVMLSNPLFWLELQSLPKKRREELKPLFSVWKDHRESLASADIKPIGDRPSGRSFTGFYAENKNDDGYLLLFREVTDNDTGVFRIPGVEGEAEILASNTELKVNAENGLLTVTFGKPRSYAFIKIQNKKKR